MSRLYDGLRTAKPSTLHWALHRASSIVGRVGVAPSGLPDHLYRVLLKKKWFRRAARREPRDRTTGITRAWPVVESDLRPREDYEDLFRERVEFHNRRGVALVRGYDIPPPRSRRVVRRRALELIPYQRFSIKKAFKWLWPAPVYQEWLDKHLPTRPLSVHSRWEWDHPHLSIKSTWHRTSAVPPPHGDPFPSFLGRISIHYRGS